jgi:hypothetical protein
MTGVGGGSLSVVSGERAYADILGEESGSVRKWDQLQTEESKQDDD